MPDHPPLPAVLDAGAHWRQVDFISDLHLHAAAPETARVWRDYLSRTEADAVFMLGDVFEVWVGDDALDDADFAFEAQCVAAMAQAARQRPVFLMHGNRDFLMGAELARRCGATLLADPCVLRFGGSRWLLSHGDAMCLGDTDYQRFRAEVRSASWQSRFLAQALHQRQAIARGLRQQSEQRKQQQLASADVDASAARQALAQAQAQVLIHGHTHRPADHDLGAGLQRWVLSDWDAQAQPRRAEVLRLHCPQAGAAVTAQRLAWGGIGT